MVGSIAFTVLGYIYGQEVVKPAIDVTGQTIIGLLSLFVLLKVYALQARRSSGIKNWLDVVQIVSILSAIVLVGVSSFGGAILCLVTGAIIAASLILAAELDGNSTWAEAGALILLLPIAPSLG